MQGRRTVRRRKRRRLRRLSERETQLPLAHRNVVIIKSLTCLSATGARSACVGGDAALHT